MKKKSIPQVIIESAIGFMFTILILVAANLLNNWIESHKLYQVVMFMNQYFYIVVTMAGIGFVANLLHALFFPLNMPAPIVDAFNSTFCVFLILRFFVLLDEMFNIAFLSRVADSVLVPFFYAIVIVIVLIVGYLRIFANLFHIEDKHRKKVSEPKECKGDKEKFELFKKAVKNGFEEFKRTMDNQI